ncbi:hypothetical protein BDDG_08547 [Blastomyces dermatitidis ATCC 18188]|uniref:Uncharacterized protein n=1 Tax=Ajellomyces dermatitidis (strain ATCC 18188 / CBS 674.68) TaxID=653446 RepID=F2TQT9_AJEDA|nr:hypothetical protein BDDG_08547 [Blastomyces dermatitidis ATCC 18188]
MKQVQKGPELSHPLFPRRPRSDKRNRKCPTRGEPNIQWRWSTARPCKREASSAMKMGPNNNNNNKTCRNPITTGLTCSRHWIGLEWQIAQELRGLVLDRGPGYWTQGGSEAKPHSVTLPTAWNSQQAISNMEIERIPKDILTASVSSVKRDILLISSRAAPGRDDTAGICCLLVHSIFLEWGAN